MHGDFRGISSNHNEYETFARTISPDRYTSLKETRHCVVY